MGSQQLDAAKMMFSEMLNEISPIIDEFLTWLENNIAEYKSNGHMDLVSGPEWVKMTIVGLLTQIGKLDADTLIQRSQALPKPTSGPALHPVRFEKTMSSSNPKRQKVEADTPSVNTRSDIKAEQSPESDDDDDDVSESFPVDVSNISDSIPPIDTHFTKLSSVVPTNIVLHSKPGTSSSTITSEDTARYYNSGVTELETLADSATEVPSTADHSGGRNSFTIKEEVDDEDGLGEPQDEEDGLGEPQPEQSKQMPTIPAISGGVVDVDKNKGLVGGKTSTEDEVKTGQECQSVTNNGPENDDKEQKKMARGERIFYCPCCPFFTKYASSLSVHKRHHTGHSYNCEQCPAKFAYPTGLRSHMVAIHMASPLLCKYCGKIFNSTNGLSFHEKNHEDSFKYNCKICGKGMSSPAKLVEHVNCHMNNRPFQCDKCGKKFVRKSNLKEHMESCYRKTELFDPKEYKCEKCNKKFVSGNSYNAHMRGKHSNLSLPCEHCGKTFSWQSSLTRHLALVHGNVKSESMDDLDLDW